MLRAQTSGKNESKDSRKKTLISAPGTRMYVNKEKLNDYFIKRKDLCAKESLSKKSHKDSNVDLESSSSMTIPSLNEPECKRASIAINTEQNLGHNHNNLGSIEYFQPPFQQLNGSKYFMFPTYSIIEQEVQTHPIVDPICQELDETCLADSNQLPAGKSSSNS